METRFVQIHTLTSFPAALLNRDDAGFAKRIPFGGVVRTRISSQCLKRHWRTFDGENCLSKLDCPLSVRSRHTFEHLIVRELCGGGLDERAVRTITAALMDAVLGKSEKAQKAAASAKSKESKESKKEEVTTLQTKQLIVLGRPEIDYLCSIVREIAVEPIDAKRVAEGLEKHLGRENRKNLQALKLGAGLDAALFGRMVTSDVLARCDAAIHVAHSFTVHEEASESDYFSAMDDLLRDEEGGELGSAHINSTELTSGLYYGYVVADVPLLVSNLEGVKQADAAASDRTLAAEVVKSLIQLAATVSPGAKLGSTAPYANASLVCVECGKSQPRTLANAFLTPVRQTPDLLANTYASLASFVQEDARMYGRRFDARLAGMGPVQTLCEALAADSAVPLSDVAQWAADRIRRG